MSWLPRNTGFALLLLTISVALPQTPARQPTPSRDPNTPGYVKAKELRDGSIPSAKEDGNFIIGPTYNPAPEMSVREGTPQGQVFEFTMESKDSKIYPGIAMSGLAGGVRKWRLGLSGKQQAGQRPQ